MKDNVAVLWNAFLELLLQVATAMLVLTERCYLALQIFEAGTSKSVNCAKQIRWSKRFDRSHTFAVDVAALVLWTVQTIHLAVGAAGNSRVDIAMRKPIASAVVMIQRRRARNVRARRGTAER